MKIIAFLLCLATSFSSVFAQTDPSIDPGSRLVNLSARITIPPGNKPQIIGFVVKGKTLAIRHFLVRAVGGSLAQFGVSDFVKTPRIKLYSSDGKQFTFPRVDIVITPEQWAAAFSRAGAFPLGDSEVAFVSYDSGSLTPGAYTIHVSDDTQKGGEVLVEVYDITTYN